MSFYIEKSAPVMSGIAKIAINPGSLVVCATPNTGSAGQPGTPAVFTTSSLDNQPWVGVAMGDNVNNPNGTQSTSITSGSTFNVAIRSSGAVIQVLVGSSVPAGCPLVASGSGANFWSGSATLTGNVTGSFPQINGGPAFFDAVANQSGNAGDLVSVTLV